MSCAEEYAPVYSIQKVSETEAATDIQKLEMVATVMQIAIDSVAESFSELLSGLIRLIKRHYFALDSKNIRLEFVSDIQSIAYARVNKSDENGFAQGVFRFATETIQDHNGQL